MFYGIFDHSKHNTCFMNWKNSQFSGKSWIHEVRCLGLSPKKKQFFWKPFKSVDVMQDENGPMFTCLLVGGKWRFPYLVSCPLSKTWTYGWKFPFQHVPARGVSCDRLIVTSTSGLLVATASCSSCSFDSWLTLTATSSTLSSWMTLS